MDAKESTENSTPSACSENELFVQFTENIAYRVSWDILRVELENWDNQTYFLKAF